MAKNQTKNKDISQEVLKEEYFLYPASSWKEVECSGSVCVKNKANNDMYYGNDARFLLTMIRLEEMRRQKVKITPKEQVLSYFEFKNTSYGQGFGCFVDLLKARGMSLDDFYNKFKNKAKSFSDNKVFDSLIKECFPYRVPKALTNRLLYKLTTNRNARHNFYGFYSVADLKEQNVKEKYKLLSDKSCAEQDLYMNDNSLAVWISVIGMGHSFHKVIGKYFFTKGETHTFLTNPHNLNFEESIVFSIAYNYSKDKSTALKLSKIESLSSAVLSSIFQIKPFTGQSDVCCRVSAERVNHFYNLNPFNSNANHNAYCRLKFIFDVIRLLSKEGVEFSIGQVGEVVDYFLKGYWINYIEAFGRGDLNVSKHNELNSKKFVLSLEDKEKLYGLDLPYECLGGNYPYNSRLPLPELLNRGLVFATLQKATVAWHYELSRKKIIGAGSWEGMGIADCKWEVKNKDGDVEAIVYVEQIKTASGLQEEGSQMRHCVSSYASNCRSGYNAIFSMYKISKYGSKNRMVTIRVNNRGTVVEAKGFANREIKQGEMNYLKGFANYNGLSINSSL